MLTIAFTHVSFAADVYNGSISSTNIQIARDLMSKVDFGEDYVFYRSGQYSYQFVVGKDIEYSNGKFSSINEVELYDYVTSSGYNADYTWTLSTSNNFTLNTNNQIVYSNLGEFPTLEERGSTYEILQTLLIVIIALCVFIRGIFFRR